jgi:hypothetical protein
MTKLKVHIEYLTYLIKHKYYVFLEGRKLGLPMWRLIIHDWSKLLPSEWFGYAEWKYKQMTEEGGGTNKNDRGFGMSWFLHTHKRNPHHWTYWQYTDDQKGVTYPVEMPETYRKEMLADWRSTQHIRFGDNNVLPYYEMNKEVILLAPETRAWLEEKIRNG